MVQKEINILLVIGLFFMMSCKPDNTQKAGLYGVWIDTKKNNVSIIIDSLSKEITIDYSKVGGKIFKATYELNNSNEIRSKILPMGGKFEVDQQSHLKIYPIINNYNKDIESIFVLEFKKEKDK